MRDAYYDVAGNNPGTGSSQYSYFIPYYADDGSNQPKLVITYTTGQGITCDAGSFTVTGQAATFRASRVLACGAGTFAIGGHAAAFKVARGIACAAGSLGMTGSGVLFVEYGGLTTVVIPYTSGTATSGIANSTNAFGSAADGNCASFATPSSTEHLLTNAVGALGYAGRPRRVEIGRRVWHASGVGQSDMEFYIGGTYLGGATQTEHGSALVWCYYTVSDHYTPGRGYWTWSDVEQLTFRYMVPSGSADTVYVDQLTIRVGFAPDYWLVGGSGSGSIAGSNALFKIARAVKGGSGSFGVAMHAAPIVKAKAFGCAAGALGIAGNNAAVLTSRKIACGAGAYGIVGTARILYQSIWAACDAGVYSVAMSAAPIRKTNLFVCATDAFPLVGHPADFPVSESGSAGAVYYYLSCG
jgi:hypothetical protein